MEADDDARHSLSGWMTGREVELSRYPTAHDCAVDSAGGPVPQVQMGNGCADGQANPSQQKPHWLPAEAVQSYAVPRATVSHTASAHAAAAASATAAASAKVVAERNKKESYHSFSPAEDSSIHINIGYRELPLTPTGSQSFLAVLQSKPVGAGTQELSPALIKSVSKAMGVWPPVDHIQAAQTSGQSAFDLRSAAIKSVNGENYLYVEGTYKNNGVPTTYMVAFLDGGKDPASETERVDEVELQGPSQTIFAYRAAFQNMLSTLRRKNSL